MEEAKAQRSWWALVVSGVFHPLLVATYMFLILMAVNPYLFGVSGLGEKRALILLLMIVLYTAVIPLISVGLMRALDMVSSISMEERSERIGPLLLVMVLYFWTYYNLSQSNDTPTIFSAFLLGVVIALGVAFAINAVDKVSLHAVGMGGLTGMMMVTTWYFGAAGLRLGELTVNLGVLLLITVILAGLVGTARLRLGAHDDLQLYVGYAVGFLAQAVGLMIYF